MEIWFRECVEGILRHGTRCEYRNAIKNHIGPALGKKNLKDISIDDLQQYIDKKQKKYAVSTMKAHWVVLNGSFRYAVYPKKYIKDNPMLYVQKKKLNKNLDTFLDIKEDSDIKILDNKTFNNILAENENTFYYLPLVIAYHTGARGGNLEKQRMENHIRLILEKPFYTS